MARAFVAFALLAGAAAGPLRAGAPPAAPSIPPKIAIADFAAQSELSEPNLSPNGRWVAAQTFIADKPELVIINADDPATKRLNVAIGDQALTDLHWAGSSKLLLTVLTTASFYGIKIPAFRLVAFDLATHQSIVLDKKSRGILGGDVLYTDPTGAWALVASQDTIDSTPSIKRVDLTTGDSTVVEKSRGDVWDWYVDSHGVVRGGIAYDDNRWTLWYRDNPGDPLHAVHGKFAKDDDSTVDRFVFSQDNGQGEVVTNEKTGRFAAYKYDFKTGTIGDPIYENPQVDIGELLLEPETNRIRGIRYEDDRWRTHWLDADLGALQTRIDNALPGAVNQIVDLSSDGNRALILSASASDPGVYFLLDRKASQMHPVANVDDRIDPASLAPVQAVSYTARDGLVIPAYLTLPRGREAKGLPLVLLPHGGPFARDDWEYDAVVQFLANRGYAVLQPEFRGSTGYGKTFVESGYGQWGRKMQDDLDDGVDWLVKSGKVDPKRVCIMGASYGGYAALWGAIRNSDRYRCAVSYAGVSDLVAQLRDNRKSFSATRYFKQWRTKVAGEGKVDLRTVSPLNYAVLLKVPVLIAHGEEDTTVSSKQSHAMVDALTKVNAKVTSVFYKTGEHTWGDSHDFADFLQRLEAFLAANNPA